MEGAREIDPILRAEIDAYRLRQAYLADVESAVQEGILTYDDADLAVEAYDNMGEKPDIGPEVYEEYQRMYPHVDGQLRFDLGEI